MSDGDLYKKGEIVIYHYKEWQPPFSTREPRYKWERALVLEMPRDVYGRFSSDMDDYDTIKLKTESGEIVVAELKNVEHDYDPSKLSDEEIRELYRQIVKGSIYLADYFNTLGVFQDTAYDYYEGFIMERKKR